MVVAMQINIAETVTFHMLCGNNEPFHIANLICPVFSCMKCPYFSWERYVVTVALGGKSSDPSPARAETRTACL